MKRGSSVAESVRGQAGDPFPGIETQVSRPATRDWGGPATVTTDTQGRYSFSDMGSYGERTVAASDRGEWVETKRVLVRRGQTVVLNFVHEPPRP